jgi:uncharacterized protein (DUF362 family)
MRSAGFKPLKEGAKDPKDDYPVHFHDTLGYEDESVETGGISKNGDKPGKSKFPKLLKKLTAVIDHCVPKDHDLTGITGAMKNVGFGNLDRVPIYHCKPECNPKCVHDGKCNVARLYKNEQLGGKVRLVICDAQRVLYEGGPQDNMTHKAAYNSILASTDPVAIDRLVLEIINELRATKKLKPIEQDRGGKRNPRFLQAATELGLGESDLAKIKWEKYTLA